MDQAGPSELTVTRDGVALHVLDWGGTPDGDPMVLLHGVGGNAWHWNALAPRLVSSLGDRYRVVSLDQRGHGDSGQPSSGYDPGAFGEDVLAVQDHLGGRPMVLVGHSRGGWLSPYIAGRWPHRVAGVVLVDPARIVFATPQDAEGFYDGVAKVLGPFSSRAVAVETARQREPDAQWTLERQQAFLAGLRTREDGSLVGKLPLEVLQRLRHVRETTDAVGPVLADATMPVLLLVATKASRERQEQKLEYGRRLPHARVEFVDSTHHIHQDQPDLAAKLITEFVSGPVAAGSTPG